MKTKIEYKGQEVEIVLTPGQIKVCEKQTQTITDRIKSFADACEQQSIDIGKFNESCKDLSADEVAYRKIKIIAKALNQTWEPDWNNSNEYKYYPYFDMRSASGFGFSSSYFGGWYSVTVCGSRLCFKSSELAVYAGKQFTDIYKDFLTIKK